MLIAAKESEGSVAGDPGRKLKVWRCGRARKASAFLDVRHAGHWRRNLGQTFDDDEEHCQLVRINNNMVGFSIY
jgi:hypothetical protein